MRRLLVSIFLFSSLFFSLFASGFVDSQDGLQYLAIARRMYYDQTFQMPVENFADGTNIHMSTMEGTDGKIYGITGLGYSLALLPAVALEDFFLRESGANPISAFPLQNDWPVLLFASLTNSVFGGFLVVGMFLYLRSLEVPIKQSLLFSFGLVVASNLFVYTKHTFAHMLFVSFLVWTFYFLKRASQRSIPFLYTLVGICFGVVILSYNQTFVFTVPALVSYYFLLQNKTFLVQRIIKSISDGFWVVVGALPFLATYLWFNQVRFGGSGVDTIVEAAQVQSSKLPPLYIIVEGIWGLLFSPGKSIFLFTPLLLVLVLFWFKVDSKKYFAEVVSFSILFVTYLWLIGTLLGGVDYPVWHGDSSWGPRYLLATLPFLLLLVSTVIMKLSRRQQILIVVPLFCIGVWVNTVGALLPYQIRFQGLQTDAIFNGRNFNVYEYGNEIPRYSPVFTQSKRLVRRFLNVSKQYDHGTYNLRLYDGFDYPFDLGWMIWRGMRPYAVMRFDDTDSTMETISVQVKNHQMEKTSSVSAQLAFTLNGQSIKPTVEATIPVESEREFVLPVADTPLKGSDNELHIESVFEGTSSAFMRERQVLFLQIVRVNGVPQNIVTLDYPYVSPVSQGLHDKKYAYWGNRQKDPWEIWHMHSGIFEQTFDVWWLRPYHYWDLPKSFFNGLFLTVVFGVIYFGIETIKVYKKVV